MLMGYEALHSFDHRCWINNAPNISFVQHVTIFYGTIQTYHFYEQDSYYWLILKNGATVLLETCYFIAGNVNSQPVIASRLIKAVGAPWSEWAPCTAKCGFGVQIRKRDCQRGNCKINTDLVQTKTCLRQSCQGQWAINTFQGHG